MQVVQKIKTLACQINLFSERVINVRNDMICPLMQLILRLLLIFRNPLCVLILHTRSVFLKHFYRFVYVILSCVTLLMYFSCKLFYFPF